MPANRSSGQLAEDLVVKKLRDQGWQILARNFRHVGCELDIVAEKQSTLVIMEVKHRLHPVRGLGEFSALLSPRKTQSLQKGANVFLAQTQKSFQTIRFDLALVEGNMTKLKGVKIRYFPNVITS